MLHLLRSATSRMLVCVYFIAGGVCAVSAASPAAAEGQGGTNAAAVVEWPAVKSEVPKDPRIETKIADLLRQMTLEQKVAQMVQADIRYITPAEERQYHLGSILNGGGAFPAMNKHSAISDWVTLA